MCKVYIFILFYKIYFNEANNSAKFHVNIINHSSSKHFCTEHIQISTRKTKQDMLRTMHYLHKRFPWFYLPNHFLKSDLVFFEHHEY